MRVVYIITRADEIGGAQVHVRDLAIAMHHAGHDVCVVAGSPGPLSVQLAQHGVPFRAVPALIRQLHPGRDLAAFLQLKRALATLRPELVSTHSSKAGWLGRLAARALRIPVVFTAHGWAFTEGVPRTRRALYAMAERWAAPLADRIVTVSDYDLTLALENRVAPRNKITRIHNGVHGCIVNSHGAAAANGLRIVMIGRFSAQKDHETLLHTLARLNQRDWALDLVGDGPLQAQVVALSRSLGIADRVRFLGARNSVCDVLREADVYTLISHWEGLPRSILEAMSAGLPVIASDVGGVSEAVHDGETGFLVPRKCPQILSKRLEALIVSADLRRTLGARGRQLYMKDFRFELMFERTVALYHQILRRAHSATL